MHSRVKIGDLSYDALKVLEELRPYVHFGSKSYDNTILVKDVDFENISMGIFDSDGLERIFLLCRELIKENGKKHITHISFKNCFFDYLRMSPNMGFVGVEFVECEVEDFVFARQKRIKEGFDFKKVSFESGSIKQLIFEAADDEKSKIRASLKFAGVNVAKIEAVNIIFCGELRFYRCFLGTASKRDAFVNFNGSAFSSTTAFSACSFLHAPSFFGASLHEDTDFRGAIFADVSSYRAWRAYRALKLHMIKFESDHEAQMFHALELEARYNTELPKGWRRLTDPKGVEAIASYMLGRLNQYGRNLILPVVWLLFVATLFLVLYAMAGGVGCIGLTNAAGWVKSVCENAPNVTYSVRNAFGPFGLVLSADQIQPKTATVKILGFIHLLISSIIWFIWILQIRSRFKL